MDRTPSLLLLIFAVNLGCQGDPATETDGGGATRVPDADRSSDGAEPTDSGSADHESIISDAGVANFDASTNLDANAIADAAIGPLPNCAVVRGSAQTLLPSGSGTLPGAAGMSTAGGSSYLYVATQWGFARAALTQPSNPGPYAEVIYGNDSNSAGVIPIACDCHQGTNTLDFVEGPSGSPARVISDWQPFAQGGFPGRPGFSGLPAMVGTAVGAQNPRFGQQIALPGGVPLGSQVAALYIASTQKFFGYFSTLSDGVQLADVSTPSGNPSATAAIQPSAAIGWAASSQAGMGVRLRAAHAAIPGYQHDLLIGSTQDDGRLHVAELDAATGQPTEVASTLFAGLPAQLEIAVMQDRIMIFSIEGTHGLQVYEFRPPQTLVAIASIPGVGRHVAVRGPTDAPIVLLHKSQTPGATSSEVDLFDGASLIAGAPPLLLAALSHFGTPGVPLRGMGFEGFFTRSGTVSTMHLYRELSGPTGSIRTDNIDVSCAAR